MDNDRTRAEFARQASTMGAAAVFNAEEVLGAIADASGHGPGRATLDVGCGPGIVAEALARRGGRVAGIDLTPEMVEQARGRCARAALANVEFVVGPAEHLPFPPGHFDAAVSRVTLHHVSSAAAVVLEMSRVLRPGGRMVVADIVSSEDARESELHNALEILRDPSHVRMLPLSELLAAVLSARLEPVSRQSWVQRREFDEWMRIVNAPEREGPLRVVMESLARAGLGAGIGIECRDGRITFSHRLVMLVMGKAG